MQTKLLIGLFLFGCLVLGFGDLSAQSDRPFSAGLSDQFPYRNSAGQQVYNLTRAQQVLRNGQWERGVMTYKVTLDKQPQWLSALVGRANGMGQMSRELEASRDRNLALRLNRVAAQVLLTRSRQQPLRFLALYPEAWMQEHGFEPGASLQPGQPHVAFAGDFDYFSFQTDRIRSAPDSCQVTQAIRLKLSGNFLNAEQLLEDHVGEQPIDLALISMLRANLRLADHDYPAAIALYDEALQLYGADLPEVYYNRGLAYVLLNNYTDGCSDLFQSVDSGFVPAADIYRDLCNL